jgi:hypothetical protein
MRVQEVSQVPIAHGDETPSPKPDTTPGPAAGMFDLSRLQPVPAGWWWACGSRG